ncbi:MAG: sodium-translocating pyrophosphatase [Anaeroplasmataceae bacterium]|nr:sodium-translocating pyrophosphatase [Anaeroplasmataceae bacterium]MDE6414713.1 sodium-translocating pyrophosphatase [Anaeroplasmataceae bacterium]
MSKESIIILSCVLCAAIVTLAYVFILFRRVSRIKINNPKVEEISKYIHEGAIAFLKREYMIIIPFVIVFAILLTVLGFIPAFENAEGVGWKSAICFVVGACFSGVAGWIGMFTATKANARTAMKADEEGMPQALNTAFSGGAVLGLTVAGLGLLGLVGLFFGAYALFSVEEAAKVVSGYGLGCSMIALFARVGGGIYTKAADVGADLVGKIESGIPEDDPRNPATIADNVGDNVGDIAGMGSDLTESYVGSIISVLTIAATMLATSVDGIKNFLFPLMIAGVGVIASMLAVIFIRLRQWKNPHRALNIATYVATGLVIIATLFIGIFYMGSVKFFFAVLAGLLAGIIVGFIAEIYTSSDYKEVKRIAYESQTGHATNIIAGIGSGMKSTGLTILALVVAIAVAYFVCGSYGIALAAVGMLSTCGITVSVDGYGPISDNAGGIAQMSKLDPHVREITDKLDSVGNTTAAIGKGFCIGSATLTSLALIVGYFTASGVDFIDISNPVFIVGLLIGAMLPYLFSSLVIASVGRAANKMIEEVRGQFENDPGILKGESNPNYAKCVDISTKASLKEMILPGVISVFAPIVAGLVFGASGLGGVLIGGLLSAIMLAVFMANSGGAWDNAKKYIEEDHFGGKGSETHHAAITGDTVGDPLKDTAGPAMDILIKLMSIISLIIAPLLIHYQSLWDLIVKWLNK